MSIYVNEKRNFTIESLRIVLFYPESTIFSKVQWWSRFQAHGVNLGESTFENLLGEEYIEYYYCRWY